MSPYLEQHAGDSRSHAMLLVLLACCMLCIGTGCAKREDPYEYNSRRTVEAEELLRWYRWSGGVDAVPFKTETEEDVALVSVWLGEGGYVTSLYWRDGFVWRWMGEKSGAPGACLIAPKVDRQRFERVAAKLTARLPDKGRFPNHSCDARRAGWALYGPEHFVAPP